jgi:caffeoyl-CoA O-methyltransferase
VSTNAVLSPQGKTHNFFTPEIHEFCTALFAPEDPHLAGIERDARARGFPAIAVSPLDGTVLRFLVTACGARHAVEIGTLGGYSGTWIARALPAGGRLDSFELAPERAAFAREKLAAAGVACEVVVHEGPALGNLGRVAGPVDFVFIDADKEGYPAYLAWAADHLRPGGIVAMDNAFAWGALADPSKLGDRSADAVAMQKAVTALARDARFTATMIPTNEGLAVGVRR